MSSSPISNSLRPLPVELALAGQLGVVERLFHAGDAVAVQRILEEGLTALGIGEAQRQQLLQSLTGTGSAEASAEIRSRTVATILAADPQLPEPAREQAARLDRFAAIRLRQLAETSRLYETISRQAMAERLQRVLYAIAEQASAVQQSLPDMMRTLHATVSSLVYAENFFVALLDEGSGQLRFPYYVDSVDPEPPSPEQEIPLRDMQYSLTWNLLRGDQPLMGSISELAQSLDGHFRLYGPRCEYWLGVPLLRDGRAVGAIVIQSYRSDTPYTEHDRELLGYVAQHVQTALERREAHDELERRVADRTAALQEANRVLRQQVLQRQHGERLQSALFRIAELANTSDSLENFYAAVHKVIGGLLYARNLYIALLEDDGKRISFPYSVDEIDDERPAREHGQGITEYVLHLGKPLLADAQEIDRLGELGEIRISGARALCWLGVPLIWGEYVMGVLAVQSYSAEHTYGTRDQELLTFVSYHIANALQRKRSSESLKLAYNNLERRVTERTRALALANRDLREQIAERERVERRLKYETLHDSLTGLPNRTLLLQRLEQALQRHRGEGVLFAVLFIDLDRFKVINDSVGHLIGDDLLFQVGGRIRACLKTSDVVARLGGDEFAVLVEGIPSADTATMIAERIIHELQAPFRLGAKEIFTSASIGIAVPAPHYRHPEELLRDADSAMYRAKDEGRHRTALFDDRLRREALSLLEMEGDLRRALKRNEFVPFYQPIVALEDGRIVGYEALLRWRHPERGLLPPDDFLAVAEENGSSENIDWQIFEQVCTQAPELAGEHGFVSINVSGRHFRSPNLDTRLLSLLAEHQVPARSVRIEVTERALLENPVQVKRILDNLREHGVNVALDDFGTGYSSLSYLHKYPIGTLKIDRSFITELMREGEGFDQSHAVVRAIQVLADSLHMQVIAEGIEHEDQRQALLRIGCRYGQGFLFARPEPVEAWLPAGTFARTR